ncbi:MAG: hypothetical protein HKN09_06365 [Saprospiraceae bacterium]|nr:hypothetical protein [Saprospiraceae bacterium]
MKQITLFMLFLFLGIGLNAQDNKEEIREKIESRKIAFLSDKLALTPETSQEFWPLYNAYNAEMQEAQKQLRPLFKKEMSDEDANALLDKMIEHETNVLSIKKAYVGQLREVIGAEKTLQFFKLDREFKERMLRDLGEKRQQRRRGGR